MRIKSLQPLLLLLTLTFFSCSKDEEDDNNNLPGSATELPAAAVHPLESGEDLDVLLQEIGDDRIVLLGEASHGTSEFYIWRAELSKRLIEEKGFTLIAVEGDWTDAYPLNNYIRGNSSAASAEEALQGFDRWPTWMRANEEIEDLGEWLRTHNAGVAPEQQVGFYGLDVYGLWESMEEVHAYLEQTDPASAQVSRDVLNCFAPYNQDENAYISASLSSDESCAGELEALLQEVQLKLTEEEPQNEAAFNALQNALVALNAERYYRTAAVSNARSWNIRDEHMTETINRLLEQHGPDSKIVVWEHNTHIGDARATDMADAGTVNVGQLVREQHGQENVYSVGFGTYTGTVVASQQWEGTIQVMNVPEARQGSWEWVLHRQPPPDKIILMEPLRQEQLFLNRIGHRAIGVTYNPGNEAGNYVPSALPHRYDAFIFIDETEALHPL